MSPQQMQAPPPPGKPVTKEWRKWEGVNVRDSRTAIGDTEFSWLENAITIGAGAIQILPREGDAVATLAQGIATIKGFRLNGLPVLIAVGVDGSLTQVTATGSVTVMAPAGTVTIDAECTIWQGTPILIIDPIHGYFSWDGTTFTVLDPTLTGEHIAVFQGRVWISTGRTISYTAPLSYTNVNPGDGAGATNITDEAFQGDITALVSALEQLWIVGDSAVEALSNVQAFGVSPAVLTTFSISNVVSGVGSLFTASVVGYFRALVFSSPFGVYALSGVTPQKISEKLDDFPFGAQLGPVSDVPAAIAVIQNTLAVLFLVSYAGDNAIDTDAPVPLIAGFVQGKWFFASQGNLLWITTLVVNGVSQAWGTDGSDIYQLFGADTCTPVAYKVQSKLYDHGSAVTEKAMLKLGIELRAQPAVASQDIFCILNTPLDAGTEWTLEGATREQPNLIFSRSSVFLDDLTVYSFHRFDGTNIQPLQYDISVDGGQTFPVMNATAFVTASDILGVRSFLRPSGVRRFIILENPGFAYSDTVITLPLTSTWTEVTLPTGGGGAVGGPIGFEVDDQTVLIHGSQGAGADARIWRSTDGGASFSAPVAVDGTCVNAFGLNTVAACGGGVWCLINPNTGKIQRSTDDGITWSAVVKTVTAGDASLQKVAAIFGVSATRVVAVYKGQVVTSDDAGLTWTDRQNLTLPANSPVHVRQGGIGHIAFFGPTAPPTLGGASNYAMAFNSSTTRGAMWRSVDLGTTWTLVNAVGGGGFTSATTTTITGFAARAGRGVIDISEFGGPAVSTWSTEGVATAPVCMTLLNDDGDVLTITHGPGACPPQPFSPNLFADSETTSVPVPVYGPAGIAFIINNAGRRMTLLNDAGDVLTIISGGLSLSKSTATIFGHYLGWTLQGTDPPFRIEAAEMEYAPTREWDTSP